MFIPCQCILILNFIRLYLVNDEITVSILSKFLVDINDCSPEPCQNGATCIDDVNQYTCSCDEGYEGTDCETSEYFTSNNINNNSRSHVALYTSRDHRLLTKRLDTFVIWLFNLSLDRFSVNSMLTNSGPCVTGHPMSWILILNYFKRHYTWWITKLLFSILSKLLVDINECSPEPCQNGATCIDDVNQYTCSCDEGYEGTDCDTSK